MKFLKNNLKLIVGILIGAILASGITVYAYSYFANQIGYTTNKNENVKSVEDALNDLYSKKQDMDYVYGEIQSSNYGQIETINLGFQPRMIVAIVPTSGGYLRTYTYDIEGNCIDYSRGVALGIENNSDVIQITTNGFQVKITDSSWGTNNIKYYAFK